MEANTTTTPAAHAQVLIRIEPPSSADISDDALDHVADSIVATLIQDAAGLALGPVAAVDLDKRVIEVEISVEAFSMSEIHQKMALVFAAMEREGPVPIAQSTVMRDDDPDGERERALLCTA